MYIQARGDKFRFFETYVDPKNNLRKTVSVTLDRNTKKSRKDAQERLNARIAQLTAQRDKYTPMPLKSLVGAYLEYQTAHVAPQTVIGDRKALKAVTEMLGEDTDINRIDAKYVIDQIDATGETNTRKNYRIKHIKKLFRWAYRYDYINTNWADKLEKYKDCEKARRAGKYLEADELRQVLNAMKVEKHKLLTKFLALSGLRVGEALALNKEDIDIKNRVINVNKSLSLVTYEIGATKTEESTRTIHIQKELLPVVKKIPPQCFHDIQYFAYNKYLKETTLKVVGRALSPHSLRHTHVSLLAGSGVPLDVISHRCGHADSAVTRDIYLHVTQLMKDKDAEILDGICLLKSTKVLPKHGKARKTK